MFITAKQTGITTRRAVTGIDDMKQFKEIRHTANSLKMFGLMDGIKNCMKQMEFQVSNVRTNRLDHVDKNAAEIERLAKELQTLAADMRRRNKPERYK